MTTAEERRDRYQFVMMARSRIVISGYREHEHVVIEGKKRDDKV